jgi:hypothetical protein
LAQKWEDLGYEAPLLVGDVEGEWVLVWGDGLQPTSDCWLKDIRKLADMDVELGQASERAA